MLAQNINLLRPSEACLALGVPNMFYYVLF